MLCHIGEGCPHYGRKGKCLDICYKTAADRGESVNMGRMAMPWGENYLAGVVPMNWKEAERMPHYTVGMVPIGKPRWSKRERWPKTRTKAWQRWLDWKDEFARQMSATLYNLHQSGAIDGITEVSWRAYFPIPKSWSRKKAEEHAGSIHQQKPDRDNVDKAILECLLPGKDERVGTGSLEKRWDDGQGPRIELWVGWIERSRQKPGRGAKWEDKE